MAPSGERRARYGRDSAGVPLYRATIIVDGYKSRADVPSGASRPVEVRSIPLTATTRPDRLGGFVGFVGDSRVSPCGAQRTFCPGLRPQILVADSERPHSLLGPGPEFCAFRCSSTRAGDRENGRRRSAKGARLVAGRADLAANLPAR